MLDSMELVSFLLFVIIVSYFSSFVGSILFLLTVFLMNEPSPTPEIEPKDSGHDNNVFSTADETALPTITSMINGNKHKARDIENSRL